MSQAGQNVLGYLEASLRRKGSQAALVGPDAESWSFFELNARVDWMAAGLRSEGIRAGDRVIVMVPMSLKLYQVLLAVLKIGAVAVFVDPWVGAKQIAAFAASAEPKGFVGVAKSHLVRLFDGRLRVLPVTVTTGERVFCVPARRAWEEVERYAGPVPIVERAGVETALITFTSGSSGAPKGADRTHEFLGAQHEALNASFAYRLSDVDMPTFPVFSLNNLANGVTTVIPDMDFRDVAGVDGVRILEQMRDQGVTTVTASPPFYDRLAEAVEQSGEAPGLRRILTGGAPVSDEQLRRWSGVWPGTEIVVIYGSTEAEPVAHIGAEERLGLTAEGRRGYCVGRPVKEVSAKVVEIKKAPITLDQKGGWEALEVSDGEVGELVVSGRHVCRGYYRNPEATAENKIVDGDMVWHRMGDTGYFDDEGRFWLTGRVHSTILRAGEAVQAQVVEQVARGEDGRVVRVAAVGLEERGLEDRAVGERLVVVVHATTQSVMAGVRQRLAKAGVAVDEFVYWEQPLPVDPRHNSKVNYLALKQQLSREAKS